MNPEPAAILAALPLVRASIVIERERGLRAAGLVKFRGAALEAQTITSQEWISAGPSETGKTFSTLWRLDTELRRTPNARAAIVRKVRADMTGTVLETWERVIAIRGGVSSYGGENVSHYDYPNGARVYVGGMDRPGKVLSGERDFIYVNQAEELALEDWETLTTRATGRGAVTDHPMLFGDCNPGPPTHWIKNRQSLRVLQSIHQDNPTLFDDAGKITMQGVRTMAVLNGLTGVRKARLLEGRWVAAEGTVYERFTRAAHVVKRFGIPDTWRYVESIDLGFTNPFVWQLWAIDPDGRMYLTREIYRTKRLVQDHAGDILAARGPITIEATVSDHDAEDRATLERYGVITAPAFKSVTVGIEAVQKRLELAEDGRPRLFVFEDALIERDEALALAKKPLCTTDEFEVYSWPKGADGRPVKEEPVKVFDHGMDATRYAVAYVDELGNSAAAQWRSFMGERKAERERAEKEQAA
jgi:phage terminase large subunit